MIRAWSALDAGADAASRGNSVPRIAAAIAASKARQAKLSRQPPCAVRITPAGTARTSAITTPR
jgi:hypothetical protein